MLIPNKKSTEFFVTTSDIKTAFISVMVWNWPDCKGLTKIMIVMIFEVLKRDQVLMG